MSYSNPDEELSLEEAMVDWSQRDDPSDSELFLFTDTANDVSSNNLALLPSMPERPSSGFRDSNSSNNVSANLDCFISQLPLPLPPIFPPQCKLSPPSSISISTSPTSSTFTITRTIETKSSLAKDRRSISRSESKVVILPRKWTWSIAVLFGMHWIGLVCLHLQFSTIPKLSSALGRLGDTKLQRKILQPSGTIQARSLQEQKLHSSTPNIQQQQHYRSIKVVKHAEARFPKISKDSKVIFYHIYLPPNNTALAIDIVQEQLRQLADSNVELFYNTIGARRVLPFPLMNRWCVQNKVNCHFLHHYDVGMEDITLQNVYDYCHQQNQQQHKQVLVGYLHNKGSHHPSPINHKWRRLMTQALVRDECWKQKPSHCNLCGLYFTADRGQQYMSGNFWTATCAHVQTLIPPSDFERQQSQVVAQAFLKLVTGEFTMTQYPSRGEPSSFGIGRYASEVWIASHPRVQPCDFSVSFSDGDGYDNTKDFLNYVNDQAIGQERPQSNHTLMSTNDELKFTPTAPTHPYKLARPRMYKNLESRNEEIREYFHLAGYLYRWIQLYHDLPLPDSWIWNHYPRGKWWKQQVQHYGIRVLDVVLKPSE